MKKMSGIKTILKKILPRSVVHLLRARRNLNRSEWRLYWKLRFHRQHTARAHLCPGTQTIKSVLFLCHGNIIRSPMAAVLLKRQLMELQTSHISVSSAGLHARPNQPADARACNVARQFGISLDTHRARVLTPHMVDGTDLIFVMDTLIETELLVRYPHARSKIFLLSRQTGGDTPRFVEVADPYDGSESDVRQCYELLDELIRSLAAALLPRPAIAQVVR